MISATQHSWAMSEIGRFSLLKWLNTVPPCHATRGKLYASSAEAKLLIKLETLESAGESRLGVEENQ
jgi:hypothetical protein